jgi:hypothetical protein
LPLLFDELSPKALFRRQLIMGSAPQAHIFDARLTTARDFEDVIELQPLPRSAPVSRFAHKRAVAAVALPNGSPYVRRDAAHVAGPSRAPGLVGRGVFGLLQLCVRDPEHTMKHLRQVTTRNLMAQQGFYGLEQIVGLLPDRDL